VLDGPSIVEAVSQRTPELAHVRVLLKSPATMTAPAHAQVWQSFEKLATGGHVCDGGTAAKH
jgi:hypothetical protein